MSFGSKLDDLPLVVAPGAEIIVTLQFTPDGEEFKQHAIIYVEETTGLRSLEITVKSAAKGPES